MVEVWGMRVAMHSNEGMCKSVQVDGGEAFFSEKVCGSVQQLCWEVKAGLGSAW